MWIVIRRHVPIVASLLFTWVAGCTLPDRPPTLADAGPATGEDASSGDASDASRGDAVRGDVSLGDAPVDLRAADGIDVSVVDAPGADGVVRDGPILTIDALSDAPTVCIPGGTCLPTNPCHQGEWECRDGGGTSCRDTSRVQTNGTPCDKGVCLDGACQACAAGTMCDVANKPCRVGTIACSTGAPVCTETDNKPNGATCGSGLVCQEGSCKPCVTGEACTPTNACHAGKLDCSAATPTCNDTGMGIPPGASCGQDKVCNPAGTCVACVGGSTCTVATNSCRSGTIACSTGAPVCIESGNTTDGTSCGMDKVCSGGICVACSPGLSCVPANPCHAGKTVCSPTVSCTDTGMNLMDGAGCGTDKVCSGGVCSTCVGGQDCPTSNPCKTGKTSCATGVSVCGETGDQMDGYICGMSQVCSKGVCGVCNTGASCPPTNPCHAGTLSCTTGTPVCNDTGMSLMNGVGCGPDLVCRGGNCVTCKAGDACQPTDTCKTGAYSCATGSQVCVANGNKATGAECEPGKVCTSAGICDICNNGGPCTPSSNVCHKGTLSCATGTGVCVDSGMPQDNGSTCGTNSVCYNGMCGLCKQGDPCTSTTSPCKNAAYVCSSGQPVCTDTTNKPAATPCGAGQTCSGGRITAAEVCNASGQCPAPPVTNCSSGACSGNACLDCGGQLACNGSCCQSNQTCCSNQCVTLNTNENCGVCGNACPSGKYCDGNGACLTSTWCRTQTIPSGVATADYQCLDFDTGMPPASVWVPNIKETGELGLLTDQVRSVPNSLHSVAWFPPQDPYPQDIAHLTWAASGNLISAVSLASDAYFTETYGGYPNGYVDYMCVTMGGTKACLSYRYPGTSTFSITFPTLAPPKPFCEVNSISYQQWMRIEMTLSTAGVLTLSTDGVTTTCSSSVPISSGASSVQIGAESISPGNWGDLRLDNLVAHVRR